jgi:hypothetical protein
MQTPFQRYDVVTLPGEDAAQYEVLDSDGHTTRVRSLRSHVIKRVATEYPVLDIVAQARPGCAA